jgi:hypothetical protein
MPPANAIGSPPRPAIHTMNRHAPNTTPLLRQLLLITFEFSIWILKCN